MKNQFDTIIFDWSGTISDDRIPVYESNKRLLKRYGVNLPEFKEWLFSTNGSIISYFDSVGVIEEKEKIFSSYKIAYSEVVKEGLAPTSYQDAFSVLEKLRNKNKLLTIVSSHPQINLEEEVINYEMGQFFKIIKGNAIDKSSDITQIIERTQSSLDRVIYIGDMVQDINAASKAGISCAVVTTGYHSRERLESANPPLGVFNNLTELSKILI
ncbi:MAG: HAD hydrolase-like protein [Nanoarchaeota archaeon]|nr:HAD hydrolase-like protein [Nanoarchaeota archaeon]